MKNAKRAWLIVLDSVGVGELPDAADFGDLGADTLGHVADFVGGLHLPNMEAMGLASIRPVAGLRPVDAPSARFGKLAERSPAKDTVTGHWEMAGLVSTSPFATFPDGFPPEIMIPFEERIGRKTLANRAASGTEIIAELGEEHQATGAPIVYTSADSVFQVAAHVDTIPLDELYRICEVARELLDPYRVARVIARPFVGSPGAYTRTYDRRDFAISPPGPTVLDLTSDAGLPVVGVGKIHDIFSGKGLTDSVHTEGNADGLEKTAGLLDGGPESGLVFVNLVDFDMRYGHRRDPSGYARALEEFDAWLPGFMERLEPGRDLLILTADHGCDPTFQAHTDHTREYIPVLAWTPGGAGGPFETQTTFAAVGATVAAHLGVPWDDMPGDPVI